MIAEPTFIASVDGLCGLIPCCYTPAGEWLGAYAARFVI